MTAIPTVSSPSASTSAPSEASLQAIPILDLTRQYALLQEAIEAATLRVLRSGYYILGPEVKAFEAEIATFLGCQHALGVANGSDALFLALKALKVGTGDEVITTSMSYIATSEAIARTGATPVFVDVESATFNMDLAAVESAITERTKALLPVHLFGQALNMDALMQLAKRYKLAVVEDCAQAIGSTWKDKAVGTYGDIGCFSFFPTKNLGAAGDGGLVCTNNSELAEKLRMLRVHGAKDRYDHVMTGINSRLDELQAALLRVKLPYLSEWNTRRRSIANQYKEQLASVTEIICPLQQPNSLHVFHQYTILVPAEQRDSLRQSLADQGISTMIYYPIPLHLQGTHQQLGYNTGSLPIAEALAGQVLSLPMYPELRTEEIERITNAIARFFTKQ